MVDPGGFHDADDNFLTIFYKFQVIPSENLCFTFSQSKEQQADFPPLTLHKMLGKVLCQGLSSFTNHALASLAHVRFFMEKI